MDYGIEELGHNPIQRGLYHPDFETANCGAGFICNMKGEKSHSIIHKALEILVKLTHRGAVSADGKTGDGAGLMIQIPHTFLKDRCEHIGFSLPDAGEYAVGMVFLPRKSKEKEHCIKSFNDAIKDAGLKLLGWREVPVDRSVVGEIASRTLPSIKQVFIGKADETMDEQVFKSKLYVIRRSIENYVANSELEQKSYFYLPSLSTTTMIFKGLLIPEDMELFYQDLLEEDLVTALALVHQRFSTNTFPTWDLAQPFRYICHNGEINTQRGNINRMSAREELYKSDIFGDDISKITPTIIEGRSDSATLDNVVELLTLTGRTLPEVMMMLVPEAWEKHGTMSESKKAFYEYNSCNMEAWDGPASIPFTDGKCIGAVLDRNGLRPSRYTVTKDNYVIMSSETGVVDIEPENVLYNGRLEPGKMFLVDMEKGCIIADEDIKNSIATKNNYRDWLDKNLIHLNDLSYEGEPVTTKTDIVTLQKAFGYSKEDLKILLTPMGAKAMEAIGSMGTDTPLAVLSEKPQLLYNYFKQLFAQVTNPPLDGIREELVTSLDLTLGREQNIFETSPEHCRLLKVGHPLLSNEELARIKSTELPGLKAVTISTLFPAAETAVGMKKALDRIAEEAIQAVKKSNATILILSDRGVDKDLAPIPALLSASFINNTLKRAGLRTQCDIIVESGEVREVHHFACLIGYSVSAINPYLAIDTLNKMAQDGIIPQSEKIVDNYRKAVGKGLVKVMSKIGISTLNSYRGAQIFEALGLNKDFVEEYFTKTITRIEGATLEDIANEYSKMHASGFAQENTDGISSLEAGGQYQWRRNGEKHMFNPLTVAKLQQAVRQDDSSTYNEFAELINNQSKDLMTLRGLMQFKNQEPISIDEVEPWTDIVKRFKTGAMSYGSISSEAHENLAIAMNRIGGKSNSGEGGEDPDRFHPDHDGNLRNSAIKQVASGRFGVSSHYLVSAKEIQIKMAQGAKPGEGGQLPGEKVYPWVAECRNSTPYVGLISPPPHHDIYSIEDLSQLIYDLKNANRKARINVKLVSEAGVGTIAAGVAKAKADVVLIAGFDGGTGASPLTSLKHTGLPWELGLAEAHQTLMMNDLRDRVVVECDGQLKTGRDVAIATLLGAEEFGFATAPLVASGCVMMRVCHLNTCPVGIATQDPELRKRFKGTPENVINYFHFVAEELRAIMAELGYRTIDEMVGQVQKLEMSDALEHAKAQKLDYSPILFKPEVPEDKSNFCIREQDHELDNVLDIKLLELAKDSLYKKKPVFIDLPIINTDRAAGTILSSEISRMHGKNGLPQDTVNITFRGNAGQSLAAYGASGITVKVYGDTNDYLGKGLSGARIIVMPPENSTIVAEENIIAGNVLLYGAIKGEVYIRGLGGERFCVRNSGASAVIEGIGDHGCEYMTGGVAVILGQTGRNFAAGMSGGIAYVIDEDGKFASERCNHELVDLEAVETDADIAQLKELVTNHFINTKSPVAEKLLADWENSLKKFIKVMPRDYKKALERIAAETKQLQEA